MGDAAAVSAAATLPTTLPITVPGEPASSVNCPRMSALESAAFGPSSHSMLSALRPLGALGEPAVAQSTPARRVDDDALPGDERRRIHVPLGGGRRHQHLARGRTGFPERLPAGAHALTAHRHDPPWPG